MNFKMAALVIPLVIFFSIDFSGLFTYANVVEGFESQLYFNVRSIVLTLGLVLLALLFLRKIKVPKNGFAKQIATRSAFIYLLEPFISYLILTYIFGAPDSLILDGGVEFYAYQTIRVVVLLFGLPLLFIAWKKYRKTGASAQVSAANMPR
jgi:hypothetical protein